MMVGGRVKGSPMEVIHKVPDGLGINDFGTDKAAAHKKCIDLEALVDPCLDYLISLTRLGYTINSRTCNGRNMEMCRRLTKNTGGFTLFGARPP